MEWRGLIVLGCGGVLLLVRLVAYAADQVHQISAVQQTMQDENVFEDEDFLPEDKHP